MNGLSGLTEDALYAEIASACYFAAVAWTKAKRTARERSDPRRRLAGPLRRGSLRYYELHCSGLTDEIAMYLSARALYRARCAAAEAELARRRAQQQLAA